MYCLGVKRDTNQRSYAGPRSCTGQFASPVQSRLIGDFLSAVLAVRTPSFVFLRFNTEVSCSSHCEGHG